MRKKRLFWQLYTPNFLIIFLAIFVFTLVLSGSYKALMFSQVSEGLLSRAQLLRSQVKRALHAGDTVAVRTLCVDLGRRAHTRITVIGPDGRVIGDSYRDARGMDNHAGRPEVSRALEGGQGTSTRFSTTLQLKTMYAAIPIRAHDTVVGVLRTAIPVSAVEADVEHLQWQIVIGGLVLALFAGLVSYRISRRITRPVNDLKQGALRFAEGDLAFRLPVQKSDELNDLALVMNQMAMQLEDRIRIITEQNTEQEAILTAMVEGVLVFDPEERLINLNRSAASLLHIEDERVRGRSIQEVVRNTGLQKFVRESMKSERPTEGYVTLFDRAERHLQVHGARLLDTQSRPVGLLIVLNDVTDLRKLENVRRDFVANVSHELKTPITSIKGFVETLLDGALDDREDVERFLGIVSKQADRLNAIIEDLLSLSRIERGTDAEEIDLDVGPLCPVLQAAVQTCSIDADARGMHVTVECAERIHALINPQLLEQAVVNLLNNAIKYSEDGATIALGCEEQGGEVLLTVTDEGCGIEAKHLPRLFERFYRIDKARSRKLGGTGLGLAIVKHIAQAHQGSVDVKSVPGKGSIFTVRLHSATPDDGTATVRASRTSDDRPSKIDDSHEGSA